MTPPTPEMVTVEIVVTERVYYNKLIDMPKSEFEHLQKDLTSKTCKSESAKQKINDLINRHDDWIDAEDVYIDTFEVYRTDEEKVNDLPF